MVMQYDEKGKIFTQIVTKNPINVIIQTTQNIIHGCVHVRQGYRLKDELNGQERFLAVTDAVVNDLQNNQLYQAGFLAVNVDQIIWIIPQGDDPSS
jgi:hypothetical protein